MLLGMAAIVQPGTRTAMMFTTQSRLRSGDILKWGAMSGGIAVTAIVIGLQWGAVGVAGIRRDRLMPYYTPLILAMLVERVQCELAIFTSSRSHLQPAPQFAV